MSQTDGQVLIGEPVRSAVLVHASIVASIRNDYAVTLKPVDGSPIADQDSLRFALHYYGRVLYELARTHRAVGDLLTFIDRIAGGMLGWRGDLFALAGARGGMAVVVTDPVGEVTVQLRRIGIREFEVDGDFRLARRRLAVSVVAVLQAIMVRVSPDVVEVMLSALANMNVSYALTHRYCDPKSFREVPAIAYHAASFV